MQSFTKNVGETVLVTLGSFLTTFAIIYFLSMAIGNGLSKAAHHHPSPTPVAPLSPLEMSRVVLEIRSQATIEGAMTDIGSGSGVVIDSRGYILTCNHVVDDAERVQVDIGDGFYLRGEVVAYDEQQDLAIVKVDHTFTDVAVWGSSQDLQLGDTVWAIGYPFDVAKLVRRGVVSGLGFNIEHNPFVVTDLQINPGDSGGAIFNSLGQLVGISARIQTTQGLMANIGIAFGIPSDIAHRFVLHNLPTKEYANDQLP